MWTGKTIPRAYVLADITTKHPIIKLTTHGRRQLVFQLNGEIRNTLASIDLIRRDNRLCGTGVYTSGATATVIRNWRVVDQGQIHNQFSDKIKGADLL